MALVIWAVFLTDLMRRRMSRVLGMRLSSSVQFDSIRNRLFFDVKTDFALWRRRRRRLQQLTDGFEQFLERKVVCAHAAFQLSELVREFFVAGELLAHRKKGANNPHAGLNRGWAAKNH